MGTVLFPPGVCVWPGRGMRGWFSVRTRCVGGSSMVGRCCVWADSPTCELFFFFPSLVCCRTGATGPAPALAGESGSAAWLVWPGEKREQRGQRGRQTGYADSPPAAQCHGQSPHRTQPYVPTPRECQHWTPNRVPPGWEGRFSSIRTFLLGNNHKKT